MHFTNKQALQPAWHAAGAQDACAVPHQTFWWGREGLHCPDLQGERRTVQSGSQKHVFLLIPLCGLIFFLVISDAKAGEFISSWIKSMEHLEVGWVGSGSFRGATSFLWCFHLCTPCVGFFWRLVFSQTTYLPHAAEQEAGCCFYNDWRKILSLVPSEPEQLCSWYALVQLCLLLKWWNTSLQLVNSCFAR